MYFKYISVLYLKFLLIIFIGFDSFFVFLDIILNKSSLDISFNNLVMYAFYKFAYGIKLFLPLSIILSIIVSVLFLVKNNYFVAFYSSGFSKKILYKPFFIISLIFALLTISLQFTDVAYFDDYAKAIKKGTISSNITKNLFLKYKDKVVYIKRLNIYSKRAYDIKVFLVHKNRFYKMYDIKEAVFKDNKWIGSDITEIVRHDNYIQKNKLDFLEFLKGFKPSIMNNIFEKNKSFSLSDAIDAWILLKKDTNINKIKTLIYNEIFFPLSFVLLGGIMFLLAPIHSRISNTTFYLSSSIFLAIVFWGIMLFLKKLALNNIVFPEIIILPFILLLISFIFYFKKS